MKSETHLDAAYSPALAGAATALLEAAAIRGLTITTAESCTGGLIAGLLTDIAGSSLIFDRGFVTYSNDAKTEMLAVPRTMLQAHGAVSAETAKAMASGALEMSRADVAVSVTGIAGPGGGSPDKPVGLVHMAAASQSGLILHREQHYGDLGRAAVRLRTVEDAIKLLSETVARLRAKMLCA